MEYDIDVIRLVKQTKDNEYVPDHTHQGIYHYLFIVSGEGFIIIDGRKYPLRAGYLATVPPEIHHEVYGLSQMCSIDIKFRVSGFLERYLDFGAHCFEGLNSYEFGLIREIFDIALNQSEDRNHLINTKMLELLFYLRKQAHQEATGSDLLSGELTLNPYAFFDTRHIGTIKKAVDYIDNHLTSPISVTDLSSRFGYTPTYFTRIFHSIVGVPPKRYINEKKIYRAKTMILSQNVNISQISNILGFESVAYFSRVFKNITGMAPMDYYRKINSDTGISLIDGIIHLKEDGFELTKIPIDTKGGLC